jgi:uracil-DNA glycosylase
LTSAPKINSTYVPSDGPKHCDIMCVGEAPGKDEEREGRPFVGRAGNVVNCFFADRLGLTRDQFYMTNLGKYRPYKNDFRHYLDTPQLEEGLKELREEIEQVKPKVIIAMGNWPLYFLTGKTNDKGEPGKGIGNWRGSVLPNTFIEGGPKVLASYHPAFLLRNWKWHPVCYQDWERANEETAFPEIRYPEYDLLVDPPDVEDVVREMAGAEFLECDIETFRDQTIACVGFCDRLDRTLVLTFKNPAWREYTEILLSSSAKKIFQFGAFDINFLWRFYRIRTVGYYFDTYVAAATITPEFPRGLDFLTSIYTRLPYYKVERKEWKKTMDMNVLWSYNGKDNISEFTIAMKQMEELREDFGWTGKSIIQSAMPILC